jgi:hypothetical protein
MTPTQAAILLMRILSIGFLVDGINILTDLPGDIYGVFRATTDYAASQRELDLVLVLVRLSVCSGVAVAFLLFSRPLAKLFARGLDSQKHEDVGPSKPSH